MTEPAPTPTYEVVRDPRPEAIVVYCDDPRFQKAFEPFIERELGLRREQFVPLVVGGGAGVLAHPERLPKEFKFMKDRFELIRDNFPSIRRVILINHEDCKYYESLKDRVLNFLGARRTLAEQSREDMGALARIFTSLLSHLGVTVELYYAKFADSEHTKIVFDRLKA
jgi:hypothetical protein